MSRAFTAMRDVVDRDMCLGCGACVVACNEHGVSLELVEPAGLRPSFSSTCASCSDCLDICPAIAVDGAAAVPSGASREAWDEDVGYTLEIWEGHAADPEIRHRGSSGGALTALSLYCLEREGMEFVLHSSAGHDTPWLNETRRSRTRAELLDAAGSRYAPASPCDGLDSIARAQAPCVFVGKPCDVSAVHALRARTPALDRRLGLVMTFFCAGTPATRGTLDLLQHMGVDPEDVGRVRYRGHGWPGRFSVTHGEDGREDSLPYETAWNRLARHTPLRCQLCPDGLGRLGDIACGDGWHRYGAGAGPGHSLILVRTDRGREILGRAREAGYLRLERADVEAVRRAQPSLLDKRRTLQGRLGALRALGIPVPRFRGFALRRSWRRLPLTRRIRTVVGTLRRAMQRR